MESVRFHMKEKICRHLFQTLVETDNESDSENLIFKASEIFSDYGEDSVVNKEEMQLLIKHSLISQLREIQTRSTSSDVLDKHL